MDNLNKNDIPEVLMQENRLGQTAFLLAAERDSLEVSIHRVNYHYMILH